MLPTRRLILLVAIGSPLWLAELVVPGGWVVGAAWFAWLAGMCVANAAAMPRRGQLSARRSLPARFSFSGEHELTLELANDSGRRLTVRIHDELPEALAPIEASEVGCLPPRGTAVVRQRVRAIRRGSHAFGPARLRVEQGIGLLAREYRLDAAATAKIYPRFHGVDSYELLAMIDRRDEVVRRPRRQRGSGTDFESLRSYVAGEDLRSVDWKATARRGTLICRNMQVERGQQVAVLLDAGRLMGEEVAGVERIEHAMNAAVMVSHVAQARGDAMAVVCFSNRIESFLPPVRGAGIMPRVLETLYNVQARPVESDYWQVTAEAMSMLRRRSLVIMLTDVLDAAGSAGLINNLTRAARRHLVLCVLLSEPRIREAADAGQADWRRAAACDLLARRRLAVERMRARGINVLETDPAHLSIQLVRKYLEIRQADLQ